MLGRRGTAWNQASGLREQALWHERAVSMEALVAQGLIRLAGLLEGSSDVRLIARGDAAEAVEARLAVDHRTPEPLEMLRIRPRNPLADEID